MPVQELPLPVNEYDVQTLQDHYYAGLPTKDYTACLNYIKSYYYEINNGAFCFYDASTKCFTEKSKENFKDCVVDKIPNDATIRAQIKQNALIYRIANSPFKPKHFSEDGKRYVNLGYKMMHQNYKSYDEYDDESKKGVNVMLEFLRKVMCSGNDDMFGCYLIYYAQIARCMKTQVIIYRKGAQGIGKSTETDFFMNHVFGKDVSITAKVDTLIKDRNKELLGKIFVVYEELAASTTGDWSVASSNLKTMCTESMMSFRALYENPIIAENYINIQINTNVNAVRDAEGRRYLVLDMDTTQKANHDYFGMIRNTCHNNQVGEAFYSYLMTVITDEQCKNFYGQRDFPETAAKRFASAMALSSAYEFIKECYVLKKKGLNRIVNTTLFKEYETFCQEQKMKSLVRKSFYKKLEEVNIKSISSNGTIYPQTAECLAKIAEVEKWLCDYDEYDDETTTTTTTKATTSSSTLSLSSIYEDEDDPLNANLDSPIKRADNDWKEMYYGLLDEHDSTKKEIKLLKKQLAEAEALIKSLKPPVNVIIESDDEDSNVPLTKKTIASNKPVKPRKNVPKVTREMAAELMALE